MSCSGELGDLPIHCPLTADTVPGVSKPLAGSTPRLKGSKLYARLAGREWPLEGAPGSWTEERWKALYAHEIALINEHGRHNWQPPNVRAKARAEAEAPKRSSSDAPTLTELGMARIEQRKAQDLDTYELSWKVEHTIGSIGHVRIDELVVDDLRQLQRHKVAERKYLEDLRAREADPDADPLTDQEIAHMRVDRGVSKAGHPSIGFKKGIGNGAINKLVSMVGNWWDEYADEHPALENSRRNPANAKSLHLSEKVKKGTWLSPTQALYLIRAAERQDQEAPERYSHLSRAGLIDLAIVTGLRVSELLNLDVGAVNFGSGVLAMDERSKTRAGAYRRISLPKRTQATLRAHIATLPYTEGLLFPTSQGNAINRSRFGRQTLVRATRLADEMLEEASLGDHRLPVPVTPHSLRRTMVSLFHADKMPLKQIQRRAGHEDSQTTLDLYANAAEDDWDFEHLREVLGDWEQRSSGREAQA